MLVKDSVLRNVALEVDPYLLNAKRSGNSLSNADIRAAVVAARKDGIDIPNIRSERSLTFIERELVGA